MNFDNRKSTKNWAEVNWDRDLWIPVPLTFEGTMWADAAEWALHYASDRAERTYGELTKKVLRKEVKPRAMSFVDAQKDLAGKLPAHKFYMHFPNAHTAPVPVGVGLWDPQGTREEAFQYYAYWTAQNATEPPVAEWFDTEALGRGVKAQWRAMEDSKPVWAVNYIFRNEEFATDVHVFTGCADNERFQEVLPDLDDLVRHIRCAPR
ncbi:MAG: hypothetical protein JO362_16350 [Streptomycetaceae bacterium]|nr:hypothetical protein [Streptomycetaceae bacterium]